MSVSESVQTSVRCDHLAYDGERCQNVVNRKGDGTAAARDFARVHHGWGLVNGRDYCNDDLKRHVTI